MKYFIPKGTDIEKISNSPGSLITFGSAIGPISIQDLLVYNRCFIHKNKVLYSIDQHINILVCELKDV